MNINSGKAVVVIKALVEKAKRGAPVGNRNAAKDYVARGEPHKLAMPPRRTGDHIRDLIDEANDRQLEFNVKGRDVVVTAVDGDGREMWNRVVETQETASRASDRAKHWRGEYDAITDSRRDGSDERIAHGDFVGDIQEDRDENDATVFRLTARQRGGAPRQAETFDSKEDARQYFKAYASGRHAGTLRHLRRPDPEE